MKKLSQLHGVFAAALTPLKPDYSPALDDLPILLDFLAQRGCHGALLLGTTGEGPSFAPRERELIWRQALTIKQKWPDFRLLAGTGTPSLDETIDLTRTAFELGLDGVVVLPPYYYRQVSEDGLYHWFAEILDRAVPPGGDFFGYHIPRVSGVALPIDLLARLKERAPDRFAGIKDSSSDPAFAEELGKRFGSELHVFNGNDSLFAHALKFSASGCITAMANLVSPHLRLVWDAHLRGEVNPEAQQHLDTARQLFSDYPPAPSLLKAILPALHKLPHWSVRPPLTPLSDELTSRALQQASVIPERIP